MPEDHISVSAFTEAINRGFSKQSVRYDEHDSVNIILQDLRKQVYTHVVKYLKPHSRILELNAGTGIDAVFFASLGHRVHATDLSDGMIREIQKKISTNDLSNRLSCQQLSFTALQQVGERNFDYIFSNFGGLNCLQDLTQVTRDLSSLLKPGGYITWVIMPPVCPWEWSGILKGNWRQAFRRLKKGGVIAHVEGEYFRTYYHSLRNVRAALGDSFRLIQSEGLAALSPPPHRTDLPLKYPMVYRILRQADRLLRRLWPLNRCADHLIVTFAYKPQ